MNLDVMWKTKTPNDARLVHLGLEGDREAFGQLVARYQSPVCALAYGACGNISHSQDLAQETFLIAWRNLRELREPEKFKPWLFGIARNVIHNTFRRQTRNPLVAAEPLDDNLASAPAVSNPTDQIISKEEEAILWRSLERIPDAYREPLILFYREQQSVERVASALDLSEEAVRQRLSRGRKLLQREVMAFIEGALQQTAPGPAFTLAVVATLPVMAMSAKAITLGVATKAGTAAKGAGFLGVGGWILGPLLAFYGLWTDYRLKRRAGQPERDLKFLRRYYIGIGVSAVISILICTVLVSRAGSLI
jgi:RNA polymerase sigma factor (sigma-70 family)